MKKCSKCKEEKDYSDFYKNKSKKDGLGTECRSCCNTSKIDKQKQKEYNKNYYLANKDMIKESVSKYADKNKEKIKDYNIEYRLNNKEKIKENVSKWRTENADRLRKYYRDRKRNKLKTDDLFKLKTAIRKRTNQAFKVSKWNKDSSNIELLGCSFEYAKQHIESRFKKGMNWSNYGRGGWHIDHIKPLASAENKQDFKNLCNINNLQPLWEFENLSKGAKF